MEGVTQFTPDQRDSFGQYDILSGRTHTFAFQVPMMGSTKLTWRHLKPGSQDFSIMLWITEAPLDGTVLPLEFGHVKADREDSSVEIFCSFLRVDQDDDRAFLDSCRTYWLNVKNLQNQANSYEVNWD